MDEEDCLHLTAGKRDRKHPVTYLDMELEGEILDHVKVSVLNYFVNGDPVY